jgi:hypothetical protein
MFPLSLAECSLDGAKESGSVVQSKIRLREGRMSSNAWQHRDTQQLGSGLSSEQLNLLYDERTLDEKFAAFHKANPHIYRILVNFCREVKGAGHDHYGIKAIFERARWFHHIELRSKEPFVLNNNFTSRYARAIMMCEPDLKEFFEVRKLRG